MQASPYSQLARQFLELWQNQMSAVLNDREFIGSMVEMMQAMGMPDAAKTADHAEYAASPVRPAHTSNATIPPDALHERLDQFDYRLRMLEKRLAALESGAKPVAGKRAGGASRRGKRKGAR